MKILEVTGLVKKYPTFALQNVSFSLEKGRIMGLIGRNGAGKSTTLKAILNLVHSDQGSIHMFGKDFKKEESSCKQDIGVVLGSESFYSHKKLCSITAVTKRFYKNWDDAAYKMLIDMFKLDTKKLIHELSTGMRIKYLIALALSHHAKLLIMDEPTSGLDPVAREELLDLFTQLVKHTSASILFLTHITSDLDKCADDITYIQNGKVLATANKKSFIQLFQKLKNPKKKRDLTLEEIMLRNEK